MPIGKLKFITRAALEVLRGVLIVGLVLSAVIGFERLAGAIVEQRDMQSRALSLLLGTALIVISYWCWGNIVHVLRRRQLELRLWPMRVAAPIPTRARGWLRFIFAGLLLLVGGLLILVILAEDVPLLVQVGCTLFGVVAFDLGLIVLAPLYGEAPGNQARATG
jgi:hypothetical protein